MPYFPGQDGPDPTAPGGPTHPADPGGYDFLGYDAQGHDVYRGADGSLFMGDPGGQNGFSPYSGTGEGLTQTPPGQHTTTPPHVDPPGTPPPTTPGPGVPAPPAGPPPTTPAGPAYTPPPAFQYDDFKDPTGQDVLDDKGYQFDLGQGMDAIGRKNAALGTLNTGGTIGDFQRFGTDLAHSKYGDIWQRKLTDYGTNRKNAVDAYNLNYSTQFQDPFSITQHNYDSNRSYDFNQWIQQYNMSRNDRNDGFDQRYRILGLL